MPPPTHPDLPAPALWHDDLRLGFTPMDDTHEEFLSLLGALLDAPDSGVADALAAVHAHTREHFAAEERWMQESDFPARDCHRDEHAAVLASMEGVKRRVAEGDLAAARQLAQALADWFPGHADYLDSALAHWMCKRTMGGKPVLLRRRPAAPATAAS